MIKWLNIDAGAEDEVFVVTTALFNECDSIGNLISDQVLTEDSSHINNNIYNVEYMDISTNNAKLNISDEKCIDIQ